MFSITSRLKFNRIFKSVNETHCRYRVVLGSAGSGKSVNVAQDFILKLSDTKYTGANLLVIRKSEGTNRYSTFAELQAVIFRMCGEYWEDFWIINSSRLMITSKITGNSIIFRGVNDKKQREKLKSITFPKGKLVWVWIEEATELEEADIDIIDDRLRGELSNPYLYYQITMTFNPVSALHWIKRKYWDVVDPDVFTHRSTYLDNKFIDAAYYSRMERRRNDDPEGFKVYGLGEWGETSGMILSNYVVEDFDTDIGNFDAARYGQDFGYNHANAILDVRFKDDVIYIASEIYCYEKLVDEIIRMAEQRNYDRSRIMHCDSASPEPIKKWIACGWNAHGVFKDSGCVMSQIDYLKQHKIIVHPSCTNTLKEMSQWRWKKDEKTGLYTDNPIEFFDDAMAALRYSVEDFRRIKTINKPNQVKARRA
jgi:phage terminase large subunit